MRRLKFLKVLMPVLLVVFLVVLVLALQPPPAPSIVAPDASDTNAVGVASGVDYVEYDGSEKKLEARIQQLAQGKDGTVVMDKIESLKLSREGKGPLRLVTDSAFIDGPPGARRISFDDPVTVVDEEDDLVLTIPNLLVDQAEGRADSPEAFDFEGPEFSGRGTKLVYGLKGQPTELYDLVMRDTGVGTLAAGKSLLHDGFSNVEFSAGVEVVRGEERLRADYLRLRRGQSRQLEVAEARGGVSGSLALETPGPVEFEGRRLDVVWDEAGALRMWVLDELARVHKGEDYLSATSIKAERRDGELILWEVETRGPVNLRGKFGVEPAWLRSERLEATLSENFVLLSAKASGRVSFDGTETRAEADEADFIALTGGVLLRGAEGRRARLARGATRVAAEEIETDLGGNRLYAARGVEATLLPSADRSSPDRGVMFGGGDAVHFVSHQLVGTNKGGVLTFTGEVRGWQGDRNLSADEIVVNQSERSLSAVGQVTTRIPRASSAPVVTEGDFVQIRAGRLDYSQATAVAVYREKVRVRLAEGWVEAEKLEVELTADNEIMEVRAFEAVQVEFREPKDEGAPTLMNGRADRLVYRPLDQTVLLYGENTPASVRRVGDGGATTSGRELRYRLDLGTLLVDSGDEGPATIRTSG